MSLNIFQLMRDTSQTYFVSNQINDHLNVDTCKCETKGGFFVGIVMSD